MRRAVAKHRVNNLEAEALRKAKWYTENKKKAVESSASMITRYKNVIKYFIEWKVGGVTELDAITAFGWDHLGALGLLLKWSTTRVVRILSPLSEKIMIERRWDLTER